jgi:cytochrome P450
LHNRHLILLRLLPIEYYLSEAEADLQKPAVMNLLRDALLGLYYHRLLFVVFSIFIALVLLAKRLFSVKYDPREPPIITHPIPLVGHVIGMFRHGASYFDFIKYNLSSSAPKGQNSNRRYSKEHNYPIYTLPTLTGRTYIITSPHLAGLIQRSSKSTSFYSAILEVTKRLCALDERSMNIIWTNVNRDQSDFGLMPESHDMIASVLGPGPQLNDITKLQLEVFTETLRKLSPVAAEEIDLLEWLREQFTLANARTIYGPENLFLMHPELIKDFWIFEQGMFGLLADLLPWIFARKVYLARKRILAGLVEYIEKERYKKSSTIIQQRVAINLKHGITPEMAGHCELIMLFAIVGNAIPTSFWLLANIYSRPELLVEVRKEIEKAVTTPNDGGGVERRIIHVDMLKSVAPVLTSCFRETMRMVANLTSVRWILEDTMIADKYLLKKDSMVQVASGVIHMDEEVWGQDAGEFNPRRFISENAMEKTATAPLPKNVPSAAFRAFGGGSVICPGRHFAQSEIVGFVAAVVMGFDLENPGGGVIELPKRNNTVIPLAVMKPMGECKVVIARRKKLEGIKWELDL